MVTRVIITLFDHFHVFHDKETLWSITTVIALSLCTTVTPVMGIMNNLLCHQKLVHI